MALIIARIALHIFATTAWLWLLTACAPSAPMPLTTDSTSVLRDAHDIAAITTAYHERLRLGLGSPFRLIEIAAHDVRIPGAAREELLRELFERTADGETYQAVHTLPAPHQRLVEHAVESARDPRVGELAVNLAYEIATLEQSVTREVQYAVSATAALLRDRALAQHDTRRVRAVADNHDLSPHALVPALRAQRALAVEQPLHYALDRTGQEEASALALMFIGGVRQAARMRGLSWGSQPPTVMDTATADRIFALHQKHERAPQSALIIAMRRSSLLFDGSDEEIFIAELARSTSRATANVAAQRASVALRPLAQERVWHPHINAPSAADLLVNFGVRITFHADVPQNWHAYYRTQIAQALTDMWQVLPQLNLQGLTIEIANVDNPASQVAFHDPRGRLIRLSPRSGSGSLAHELGHDLDWQIARRAYGTSAEYASDFAVDVAAATALTAPNAQGTLRPTELFARQFDWVIAAMLAEQGLVNATLSAVQHEWLPGHGGATPPAANTRSARAFAGTLGRAARLDQTTKSAIEQAVLGYGLPASLHAVRAVRSGARQLANNANTSAASETRAYIDALFAAAGILPFAPAADEVDAQRPHPSAVMTWTSLMDRTRGVECGAFTLKLCLL